MHTSSFPTVAPFRRFFCDALNSSRFVPAENLQKIIKTSEWYFPDHATTSRQQQK